MRTTNVFYSRDRFWAWAAWRDADGVVLVLPGVWWRWRHPGADSRVLGLVVGLGRWRARWDWGFRRALPTRHDHARDHLDAFLAWGRATFHVGWGRQDLDALLLGDPPLQRLCILGAAAHHYGRVILARRLMDQATPTATAPPPPLHPL